MDRGSVDEVPLLLLEVEKGERHRFVIYQTDDGIVSRTREETGEAKKEERSDPPRH